MSIEIRTSTAAIAMLALLVSLSACAQADRSQMAQKARDRFNAADVKHVGLLSRKEAREGMPRLADHFDQIDTDHDGQLSMAEIVAYVKQRRASR